MKIHIYRKKIVTILAIAFCLVACGKDDDADLLIGTWQMVGWSGYCPTGNKTSSGASYEDDKLTLNADSTFVIDYGENRGSTEPSSGNNSGTWTSEEKDGKRTITITSGNFWIGWTIQSFTIAKLDAQNFVFDWAVKNAHPKGPTVYTFKR